MALTKTVNYTQNVPQALGYSTEVTGTAGVVTAIIKFNARAGTLNVGTYGSSQSLVHGFTTEDGFGYTWEIVGTETDVNAAINNLEWIPRAYNDPAIEQNYISQDRSVSEYKGELMIEVEDRNNNFAFVLGDKFYINNTINDTMFTVVAIEETLAGKRLYGMWDDDYKMTEFSFGGITPYLSTLKQEDGTLIDYIVDRAIINPHGRYELDIEIFDDGVSVDTGTTTIQGTLFVPEPQFSVSPPTSIPGVSTPTTSEWTPELNLGTVTQSNNELISVQLLMKRDQNDPAFTGNFVKNSPSYISDSSYGEFSVVRVDDRQSKNDPGGVVRWEFYGTPAQCSTALSKVQFYQPKSNVKDFYLETRIVNGRTRISNSRGYN